MMMVRKKTAVVICYIVTSGEKKGQEMKEKGKEFSWNAFLEALASLLALILHL